MVSLSMRTRIASGLSNRHSQTVITRQPSARSRREERRSRRTFASNFSRQNVVRDLGEYASVQPGCRCQKQPCTKIAKRCRRMTTSGEPGSDLTLVS